MFFSVLLYDIVIVINNIPIIGIIKRDINTNCYKKYKYVIYTTYLYNIHYYYNYN